jgi:hypothetical protein
MIADILAGRDEKEQEGGAHPATIAQFGRRG